MTTLDPRSVLDGRAGSRAPVPLIIGLVVSGVCVALALTFYLAMGGPVGVAIGAALALPTAIVAVALILLVDRLEPEPTINLVLALGWGAGVAVVGALVVNSFGGELLLPVLGPDEAQSVASVLCAPFVEESFKGALLLLLLWTRRQDIDGPTDGIVYASMTGLGFALVENVLYYMRGLDGPGSDFWMTVLLRGVIAPLGHPLYTSIIGLGVAYAATHRGREGLFAVVGGWLGAVGLHALWNVSTLFGYGGLFIAYAIEAAVLVLLVVILVRDRRRLVGLIRTYLPSYIPSGLVHPQDVRMLGSISGRRRARNWAWGQAGAVGARAMGDYQLAATELALLHEDAARDTVSAEIFYSRRDAILRLMGFARKAFFRRLPRPAPPPWAGQERTAFVVQPGLKTERFPVHETERLLVQRTERPGEQRTELLREDRTQRLREDRTEQLREDRTERLREDRTQQLREDRTERLREDRTQQLREDRTERPGEHRTEQLREGRTERLREGRTEWLRGRRRR